MALYLTISRRGANQKKRVEVLMREVDKDYPERLERNSKLHE